MRKLVHNFCALFVLMVSFGHDFSVLGAETGVCTSIESRVLLNDGTTMPWLGLGVYKAQADGEAEDAVYTALKEGYRHIDTAEAYRNEADVGKAIKRFLSETGLPRSEIFVTTKFAPKQQTGDGVRLALQNSLSRLELEYVDLYLIHAPINKDQRRQQWEMLELMRDEGLTRSNGVSNYGIHHLQELLSHARYPPSVNQVEMNPYITRTELARFCAANEIIIEAYSPLTKGRKLSDPKLVDLANKYSMTPAQVLIRWCLQRGYVVIPKSTNHDRIRENAKVFSVEISEEDLTLLDSFDEYFVTGWDPTVDP